MQLHRGAIVEPWKFHEVSNVLQVCGNPEYHAECGAQFCDIFRLSLLTYTESINDQHPIGKQGVELCNVLLSSGVVLCEGFPE